MSESEIPKLPDRPKGRPKQPYCPDCRRNGDFFVLKRPGQGYCANCHSRRTRLAYEARMKEGNPSYAAKGQEPKSLEDDIRAALAKGMPLDVSSIRNLYEETGLQVPSDQEIETMFFSSPPPSSTPTDSDPVV